MKRSSAAALLSAFIFPGVGHLYLKRFVPGILLAGGAACAVYYISSRVMSTALEIVEKIQAEGAMLDTDTITRLISEQSQTAQDTSMSIATTALLALWIIGIVDSYRLGRIDQGSDKAR